MTGFCTTPFMKQQWTPQELIDHWLLTDEEVKLVTTVSKSPYNQVGCALLLKCFQHQGKFPQRKQDIPRNIVEHIAQQLTLENRVFNHYSWNGRTSEKHRSHIRKVLGIRIGTITDADAALHWLEGQNELLEEHNVDRLKEIIYERYRDLTIEPPQPPDSPTRRG